MVVHSDEADGPTLQAVLDAVIERSEAQERTTEALQVLSLVLADNTAELRRTQNLLDKRPIKEDVAYHRRRSFVVALLIAFAVVFGNDHHVEHCGPGVEAKRAVQFVLENPSPLDREALRASLEEVTPGYCTVLYPFHVHDDAVSWPNERAIIGLTLYSVIFAALFGWLEVARRRMMRARAAEKAQEPRNRREGDRDTQDPS